MKSIIFGTLMLALGAVAQPLDTITSEAAQTNAEEHSNFARQQSCGLNHIPPKCNTPYYKVCICPSGKSEPPFHS